MNTSPVTADPGLARLADALLIPPFPGSSAPAWVLSALGDGLAGVTVFGPNIASQAQLAGLIAELRDAADEPLIAIDEEGGDVTRIAHQTGSPYPGNAALGAVDDVALTEAIHQALGADLAELGVNLNLAPSVDVNTAADNPVIGTRSFGADTALVARHAAAAVAGLQAAGVAACAKHFPGHGSTSIDSHHVIAAVNGSFDVVAKRDLPPFEAAIEAGVRAVMPGHLRVPGLTGELPASLSAAALTGLLRGELAFGGVIVSDALEMRAVAGPYGIAQAAVLAVAAGTDLLCFGRDHDEPTYLAVRDALVEAVRSGQIPASRLEESAGRVHALRSWAAASRPPRTPRPASSEEIGLAAARRAIQVHGSPGPLTTPLLAEIVPPSNIAVGTVPWGLSTWVPAGDIRRISTADDPAAAQTVLADAAGRSLIVVVRDAHRYRVAQEIVSALIIARPDSVIVEMGLPVWHPPAEVYLATFGATRASSQAAAQLLGLTM
ncbi:MAG TPA: glycoside hydrolase family 3 N-terminal domain-containing protein [Streptosporangiaceae bacterium]|nr:glycoside hydrolase family 3 N-terminal domain-containing protein [Streptosporangiaceae bacterium]